MAVLILRGIPGSGKSHHANRLPSPKIIVSADDHFIKNGVYTFNPNLLGVAHSLCFRAFINRCETLSNGTLIVVDNTNTSALEMAPYYLGAKAFGHSVKIHTIICDPIHAFPRNQHGVSFATIERMAKALAENTLPPFWDVDVTESVATF